MAQTPTTMSCSLYPDRSKYNLGDEIEIIGEGATYTGSGSREDNDYTFYVQWHKANTSQDPDNDPVIEGPVTKASDKWGKASVFADPKSWRTGSDNLYYGKVTYTTTDATPTTIYGVTDDFEVRSSLEGIIADVEATLGDLQRQPIMNLISASTNGGTTFEFGLGGFGYEQCGPLLGSPAPTFRKLAADGTVSDLTPSSINYTDWTITTSSSLDAGDEVELVYALFKFWPESELEKFVGIALSEINSFGSTTTYSIDGGIPDHVSGALVMGARYHALQDLIMSIIFQNKKLIFADDTIRAIIQEQMNSTATWYYQTLIPQSKKRGTATPAVLVSHEGMAPVRLGGSTWYRFSYLRGAWT